MPSYYSHRDDFHQVYQYPSGETIPLKGNSANAKYCVFSPSNSSNNFIIKVQVTADSDPIVNDSIMNFALNTIVDEKYQKYFMKLHGSFYGRIDKDHYYIKSPNSNLNTQDKPVLVLSEVSKPIPLYALLEHPEGFEQLLPKFGNFVHCLLDVGQDIGFAHHDMHTGNILYNSNDQHFVLIDYGRVHIPRVYDKLYERQNEIDKFIKAEKQKFGELYPRYFKDPYTYPITLRNPKTCYEGKEMYILNDLAGLCFIISTQLGIIYNHIVEDLLNVMQNADANPLNKVMLVRRFFKDKVEPDVFALLIGLVWYERLVSEYKKYKDIDRDAENLYIYHRKYYSFVNPNAFNVIKCNMWAFYNSDMKSLIGIWKTYRGAEMDGGRADILNKSEQLGSIFKQKPVQQKVINIYAEPEFYEDDKHVNLNIKAHTTMFGEEYFKILALRDADLLKMKSKEMYPDTSIVGGKAGIQRKIYIEKDTKRKYVKLLKKKWYLDENRGKYRYPFVDGVKDLESVIVK
jgi:hypothetical protein